MRGDEGFRGGIGGLGGEEVNVQESPRRDLTTDAIEQLVDAANAQLLGDVRAALDQSRAEIEGLRQQIVQMEGEKQQIINACAQYQEAIGHHTRQINTLAGAVSRNYRVEAARIAATCRQPAESVQRMREMTEMWLEIFQAPEEPSASGPGPDSADGGEIPRGIFLPANRDTSKDN